MHLKRGPIRDKNVPRMGEHSTIVRILASGSSCPGLIPSVPKTFSEEKLSMLLSVKFSVAEANQQWLENVD